jgi:hypothetical protein
MRHNCRRSASRSHSARRGRRCRQVTGSSWSFAFPWTQTQPPMRRFASLWGPQNRRLLQLWPAAKVAEYALAGSVGVGQARRWCTLSGLSRLKQSRFTT